MIGNWDLCQYLFPINNNPWTLFPIHIKIKLDQHSKIHYLKNNFPIHLHGYGKIYDTPVNH